MSGSLDSLVKSTFSAQGHNLHRFHLHSHEPKQLDTWPGVQCSCVAAKAPATRGASSLGIQSLNGPGKIFFVPVSVSWFRAPFGNFSRKFPISCFCSQLCPVAAIAFPAGNPVVAAFPGSLAATFPVLKHFQQLGYFPSWRSYFGVCFHCATSPKTLCPLNSASLSNPQVSPKSLFLQFLHFFILWPHHLLSLYCPSSSLLPQATKLMLV